MKPVYIILLLGLLTTCSYMPSWVGASEEKPLEGDRIAILPKVEQLKRSDTLSTTEVLLPKPTYTEISSLIGETHRLFHGHHDLPERFTNKRTIKTDISFISEFNYAPTLSFNHTGLFLLSPKGKVVKYYSNLASETPIWSTALLSKKNKEPIIHGGIATTKDQLFVSLGSEIVYALDSNSGKIQWTTPLPHISRAPPVARNGIVFFITIDNQVFALNQSNGAIIWSYNIVSDNITSLKTAPVTTHNAIVFVPFGTGDVAALTLADGNPLWQRSFGYKWQHSSSLTLADIDLPPIYDQGILFIASKNNNLSAIDANKGILLWEQPVTLQAPPFISGDFLFGLTHSNQLLAIHVPTGGIKWVKPLPATQKKGWKDINITWSGPIVAKNQLWIVGNHGELHGRSVQDGSILTRYRVPENIKHGPTILENRLYLVNNDGLLTMLY